jgi:hypothetical protein
MHTLITQIWRMARLTLRRVSVIRAHIVLTETKLTAIQNKVEAIPDLHPYVVGTSNSMRTVYDLLDTITNTTECTQASTAQLAESVSIHSAQLDLIDRRSIEALTLLHAESTARAKDLESITSRLINLESVLSSVTHSPISATATPVVLEEGIDNLDEDLDRMEQEEGY